MVRYKYYIAFNLKVNLLILVSELMMIDALGML